MRGHVDYGVYICLEAEYSYYYKNSFDYFGKGLTKGTPEKFQKITMKPHFSWNISQV